MAWDGKERRAVNEALQHRVDRLDRDMESLSKDVRALTSAVAELSKSVAVLAEKVANMKPPGNATQAVAAGAGGGGVAFALYEALTLLLRGQ